MFEVIFLVSVDVEILGNTQSNQLVLHTGVLWSPEIPIT